MGGATKSLIGIRLLHSFEDWEEKSGLFLGWLEAQNNKGCES